MTTQQQPIRIGIVGLGRSGHGLHLATVREMPDLFEVVAVVDPNRQRSADTATEVSCRAHADVEELGDDVELVVIASPTNLHVSQACAALASGKHVIVEKPVAVSVEEVDTLQKAASAAGRLVIGAQNLRFTADFLKVREVLRSGVLGRIIQIDIRRHAFRRRWDWQTLTTHGGGMLNNDASHVADQVLALLDDYEPKVMCTRVRTPLSLGDAEDHVKIVLTAPGMPIVDLELTSACAYPQDQWLILGTQGSLVGGPARLQWRHIDPATLAPRLVSQEPTPDRGYNNEVLTWTEAEASFPDETYRTSHVRFYQHVHDAIRCGAPLAVPLADIRRQASVLDVCRGTAIIDHSMEIDE